jgi:DNA-binding beta-propeller fold protein YncE
MRLRFLLCGILVAFAVAAVGCGDLNPVTAPHAVAIVRPLNGNGPAYLFATNRYMDEVYRVNLGTYDVDSVKVGREPLNLAASPDGKTIAVASEEDESITLIHAMSLSKREIHTGRKPRDVRFSPNSQWVAVANYENESVSLIDTNTGQISDIWVGGGPISVAFDQTSRIVAVACYQEEAIKVLSVKAKAIAATWYLRDIPGIDVYSEPQALAFGPAETDAAQSLFVGMRTDDFVTEDSYADSVAVIPVWVGDGVLEYERAQSVRAGPNPRAFIFDHGGTRAIAINHLISDYYDTGYQVDTLSVLSRRGDEDDEPVPVKSKRPSHSLLVAEPTLEDAPADDDDDTTDDDDNDDDDDDDEEEDWREVRRYPVDENPIAATLHPTDDRIAVASRDGDSVTIIDLDNGTSLTVETEVRPYALSFNAAGGRILVVHETPLMPLTEIDPFSGGTRVIHKSLSLNDYVE